MRKLVLWGHHADEYQEMFDLSDTSQTGRFLEYGCGASAVNAEWPDKSKIVSCDPLFVLDKPTLSTKVSLIFEDMVIRIRHDAKPFDFRPNSSLEAFIASRKAGMKQFFDDYEIGKVEKRYIPVNDLNLPFKDFEFDMALSSHYLFADLEDEAVDFHLKVIKELARVAKEVRIFPLIDRVGQPSRFLGPVLLGLQQDNYGVEVREVTYHSQLKGNAMLRVWAQQCQLS